MRLLKMAKKILMIGLKSIMELGKGLYSIGRTLLKGKRYTYDKSINDNIIILGNGPSLKEIDLDCLIKRYDFACVNGFVNNYELFMKVKPKYYFLLDPAYFEESSPFRDISEIENINKAFRKVNWNMKLIIPQNRSLNISNKYIQYEYISTQTFFADRLKKFQYWLYRSNYATCGLRNVICGALHYFILYKFKTIYIAGVDMNEFKSFTIDERNHVIAHLSHFYGEEQIDLTENGRLPLGTFHIWLENYSKMLIQFHLYKEFANVQGVKIFNLTLNSFIDAFEKTKWNSL